MHLATEPPTVTSFGEYVTLHVISGPETIRIVMTPNAALRCGHALTREGAEVVDNRRSAEIVPFASPKKRGRAK